MDARDTLRTIDRLRRETTTLNVAAKLLEMKAAIERMEEPGVVVDESERMKDTGRDRMRRSGRNRAEG